MPRATKTARTRQTRKGALVSANGSTSWKVIYNSKGMTEWRTILPNGNRLRVAKFKGSSIGLTYIFHNKEFGLTKHISLSKVVHL